MKRNNTTTVCLEAQNYLDIMLCINDEINKTYSEFMDYHVDLITDGECTMRLLYGELLLVDGFLFDDQNDVGILKEMIRVVGDRITDLKYLQKSLETVKAQLIEIQEEENND